VDKEALLRFLHAVGCENIKDPGEGSGWIRSTCPLAPWFHEGGKDKKPSFGVKVTGEAKHSSYHCFGCGSSGILPRLLHNLQFLSGVHYKEASNILSSQDFSEEGNSKRSGRVRLVRDKWKVLQETKRLKNLPVPEEIVEKYPLVSETDSAAAREITEYFKGRKIAEHFIKDYKLRIYVDDLSIFTGVVFPIMDREGKQILDMYVRMIEEKSFFRLSASLSGSSVEYFAPNVWFGNQFYDPEKPLMLVEGAMDALRLRTLGIQNVWASMGEVSEEQLARVHSRVVYFGFDSDEGGRRFTKKAAKHINAPSRFVLRWDTVGAKDAGDLEDRKQFRKVFDNRIKLERMVRPAKPAGEKKKKSFRHLTFDPFDL
jgi:hypothetical protein